jgi:hypothetical protein
LESYAITHECEASFKNSLIHIVNRIFGKVIKSLRRKLMSKENKSKAGSLLEKMGLVESVENSRNKKKEQKLYIITFTITIVLYEIIDYIGIFDLNGKFFSVKTIYFFIIWITLFSIVRLVLVSTVFKNKK